MSEAEYLVEQMMFESAMRDMWDDSEEETTIDEYIRTVSLQELLKDTGDVLQSLPPELHSDAKVKRARDILQKGIIYQKLSYKQKYALGAFVDHYQ